MLVQPNAATQKEKSAPPYTILPEYCRLCLSEDVMMVVPRETKVFQQLSLRIKECLDIALTVRDLCNSYICKKCHETIEQFHQYRTRCTRYQSYLSMRKSMDPDRSQPLRYKDNWYWYSCLGNNMQSVFWGCSVVCCPAYIITYPSGKVCSDFSQHQHKQKMDDVKQVYCNGEFVYDGYRYSFETINPNRTLTFTCRSLEDPERRCSAGLITNDRSEVLNAGTHVHPRETIIESAVLAVNKEWKQSVIFIRGTVRQWVLCLGYWYEIAHPDSSVTNWRCIRNTCKSWANMVDGTVEFHNKHNHSPVWLKWGADVNRIFEPKQPTLMKVINPNNNKKQASSPPNKIITANSSVGIISTPRTTSIGLGGLTQVSSQNDGSLQIMTHQLSTEIITSDVSKIKDEPIETSQDNNSTAALPLISQVCSLNRQTVQQQQIERAEVILPQPQAIPSPIPLNAYNSDSMVGMVRVRANRPIEVITKSTIPSAQPATVAQLNKRVFNPSVKITKTTSETAIPKILNVMSLNQTEISGEQSPLPDSGGVVVKEEPREDEPETITDEVLPDEAMPISSSLPGYAASPNNQPTPMMLVASGSVTSDNMLQLTPLDSSYSRDMRSHPPINELGGQKNSSDEMYSAAETDDDALRDLQDDGDIPPIQPVDVITPKKSSASTLTTKAKPIIRVPLIRKIQPHTSNPNQTSIRLKTAAPSKPMFSGKLYDTVLSTLPRPRLHPPKQYPVARDQQRPKFAPTVQPAIPIRLPNSIPAKKPSVHVFPTRTLQTESVTIDNPAAPAPRLQFNMDQKIDDPVDDPIAVPSEPHELLLTQGENSEKNEVAQIDNDENGVESNNALPDKNNSVPPEADASSLVRSVKDGNEERKTTAKTVQLVKLQKSEQMLNYEGHLYKLKWCNQGINYWECMLREQVHCTAVLETRRSEARGWSRYGSHNHKVPKPIINDESCTKYQMLNSDTGIGNLKKVFWRTMPTEDIKEQDGKMMYLSKGKIFNYKIRWVDGKVQLYFLDYTYEVKEINNPGYRWKCVTCKSHLDTDEQFTIAKITLELHNHEPKLTVIDLALDEGNDDIRQNESMPNVTNKIYTMKPTTTAPKNVVPEVPKPPSRSASELRETQKGTDTPEMGHQNSKSNKPVVTDTKTDEDDLSENQFSDNQLNSAPPDQSDDEDVLLDPLTGEFTTKGDLKRKEYRAMLDEDLDDGDDDAMVLDPLTGKFRRKGDLDKVDPKAATSESGSGSEVDEPQPQAEPLSEDYEELLKGNAKTDKDSAKAKKYKSGSLAALKKEMTLYKKLVASSGKNRSFEVVPLPEKTCLIKHNDFTYQLDAINDTHSIWKCSLSPQYVCRGRLQLDTACKEVTVFTVNHCHPASLTDMFDTHTDNEKGKIKDTDQDSLREYTFHKRPDNVYLLLLDDGFVYTCLTISKTGVSSWRCFSRQSNNCKAVLTMEGNFSSVVRNRFNHSHEPQGLSEIAPKSKVSKIVKSPTGTKRNAQKPQDEDRRKRKRQTL